MQAKAGELAGKIWQVLNENGETTAKNLKKAIKVKSDKDLYLGLGWLLREDKLNVEETEADTFISLK
jgi:23S rRNA maturation-related 3'-5' exoribonuclease YhaM